MGPGGEVTVNDEEVNLPYTKTWRTHQSVSIIKAGETVRDMSDIYVMF